MQEDGSSHAGAVLGLANAPPVLAAILGDSEGGNGQNSSEFLEPQGRTQAG